MQNFKENYEGEKKFDGGPFLTFSKFVDIIMS